MTSAASTSIVEVETDESLFKLREQRGQHRLHQRPPSTELEDDSEDKLMMTEYDEDNVIVIDLSEERNASAKKVMDEEQPIIPKQMFGSLNGTQWRTEEINTGVS